MNRAGSFADVPFPFCWIFHFIQKDNMMVPGNLCKQVLHNCPVTPGPGEFPYSEELREARFEEERSSSELFEYISGFGFEETRRFLLFIRV